MEVENQQVEKNHMPNPSSSMLHSPRYDSNNNGFMDLYICNDDLLTDIVFPKPFAWDWPFSDDGKDFHTESPILGIARGQYMDDKLTVCLPFSVGGGTGERHGTTKKVEKISESNFSWTIGLSTNASNPYEGNAFWRMELEIMRSLNMLVLMVTRDISYHEEKTKRLKSTRKVYKIPYIYDVSTLTTKNKDFAIVLEALRRRDVRTNKIIPLKRSDSSCI